MRMFTLFVLCAAPSFGLGLLTPRTPAAVAQDPKPDETRAERVERKVRQLIEALHAREASARGLETSLKVFDGTPGLPKGFGERFKEEFDIDELLERTIPSYVKRLDESQLDAALSFYATEEGKKFAEQMVEVQLELIQIGQEYGRKIGTEVGQELSGR